MLPDLHSDNSILKLEIGSEPHNRGKGLWKFNNSLLHDVNNVNHLFFLHNCKTEYSSLEDKGLAWEMTKMKTRALSVCIVSKKKKIDTAFKKSLEKDLENLQETLHSNPSHQSQELYDSNKKNELENI